MLLLYDPFFMIASIVAYVAGFIVLQFLAARVAPKLASRVSGRIGLHAAMAVTGLVIVLGGVIAIYAVYAAAASVGYRLPVVFMAVAALAFSIISYLLSPFMINAAYRARSDPELQSIVDRVAGRAGISAPKAVLVGGPPNAFAYGNFLSGRYVAVSESLYSMLEEEELEAVVGHELGHHKHRDTVLMLVLGLIPSLLYYMGVWLIRAGMLAGYTSRDREESGGGVVLAAIGVASVMLSFVMQVAVLAFSRLREYYADAHGALVAGVKPMQRALAKIHLYYSQRRSAAEAVERSSIKALFIYALTSSLASPFYEYHRAMRRSGAGIDEVIEALKREPVDPAQEFLSDHPPIPKRLRFLDNLQGARVEA